MRLFVALLPPEIACDEIEAAVGPRRADWPSLRWTRRSSWHVTLAFYGEVEDRVAARLLPRLERAARRHPCRELSFAGAGTFPRPARARTLWAGISGDLRRLAESCQAAARREGIDLGEYRPFHAHLTLARARGAADLRPLVGELERYAGTPWLAEEIHLVRSDNGPEPRYETLCSWPLSPASDGR
jgi:RNA 2',3'-cyclic 3'-phosphodiesterase